MGILSFFSKKKIDKSDTRLVRGSFAFRSGEAVSEDTAMMVASYYRGVVYVSTQLAKLPLKIKTEKNVPVRNSFHKLLAVKPNEDMNAFKFFLLLIQTAIHHGNFYAEIVRNGAGKIVALNPIDPVRVQGQRDDKGKLWYVVNTDTQGQVLLRSDEMFHIPNFHTKDGIFGQGLIAYGATAIGTSLGADRFAGNLFANGGMPSGVITAPGALSDNAFKRLKESWDRSHSGKKTGGTAILEEGTRYEPISFNPEVMQFLESRKFNVIDIARFLGVPPSKLFDTEVAKYSNIEQSNLEVQNDTLDPWIKNIEAEINLKILFTTSLHSDFDIYELSRGDMATRGTYFLKMLQSGAISPNEIREKEGVPTYEGGDRYYIASNNLTPQDRQDELIDANIKSSESVEPAKKEDEDDNELTDAVVSYLKKR